MKKDPKETYVPESLSRVHLDNTNPPRPLDIDRIPVLDHPTKTTKLFNKFAAVALLVVALAIGFFMYWSLQPTNALEIKNNPFPSRVVADPTGATGGTVYMTVDYCKNTDKNGEVRVSYLSASREQFTPIVTEHLKPGCRKEELPVVIPTNLSQDKYTIKFRVSYDYNPIKKDVPQFFESQPIDISAAKAGQ